MFLLRKGDLADRESIPMETVFVRLQIVSDFERVYLATEADWMNIWPYLEGAVTSVLTVFSHSFVSLKAKDYSLLPHTSNGKIEHLHLQT